MEVVIYCSECGGKTPHTLFKPASDDGTIYFVCGKCKNDKKYLYRFETRDKRTGQREKTNVFENARKYYKDFFR